MDEDLERLKALVELISDTVINSYTSRFKRFDQFERAVITNSLIRTLVFFLANIKDVERHIVITSLIEQLEDLDSNLTG